MTLHRLHDVPAPDSVPPVGNPDPQPGDGKPEAPPSEGGRPAPPVELPGRPGVPEHLVAR
ncbi:MAG TPA: hypothetical protein VFE82_14595 [Ramlibacter sp.]|jgi:hypothetical protein|uniref:hypothetical protein n=1 Tax=Ramlibacter sp. TaxID=1917967 RepID=UPI002D29AF20|nr:hypothetical protein [Ramlibacter sp.]HZY19699.1 hypothetical protein [Ramlibacter sp.]